MRAWKITTRISGVLALTMLVGILGGGFLYQRLRSVASSYERLFDHNVQDQDLSRVMQLTFKKQVQEWKDLLLRGQDPQALQTYSAAFHQQGASLREIAERLKRSIDDGHASRLLDEFVQAHDAMMAKYNTSLAAFTASNGTGQAAADAMVKGQDRAPTDLIHSGNRRHVAQQFSPVFNWSIGRQQCAGALVAPHGSLSCVLL